MVFLRYYGYQSQLFQLVVYADDSRSRFIFQPLANQWDYLAEQASYSDDSVALSAAPASSAPAASLTKTVVNFFPVAS